MEQKDPVVFEVRLTAKDLWKFSMYHSNKGMLGIFNVIFSLLAIFLLITSWSTLNAAYRILLLVCALMFTVWQPFVLYLKAARQAKRPVIQNPMELSFSREGLVVKQGEEQMELSWDQMGKAERVGKMIILYMDRVHAYLLPDSATGDKKDALTALLKEYMPQERRKRI
ncbi:MAG TPA: YcxB family protein [Candidatus Hungatella pullicola]|nr:YcxB family protein [Candidatus Hungatella pullicola]